MNNLSELASQWFQPMIHSTICVSDTTRI